MIGTIDLTGVKLSASGGEGFEPPDREDPVNGFQGCRIQPLCHPSGWAERLDPVSRPAGADDHRDAPLAGALLVAREARVEAGGEVPEPLRSLALGLAGPVAAAAALGPELDLRVRDQVVVPGRVFAVAAPGGDQDRRRRRR